MPDPDKKHRVAAALLDLTEREALTWEQFRPDAAELPDDLPAAAESAVFAALHDDMDLYLYREAETSEAEGATPRLEVTDPESGAGWRFPEMGAVEDLYELVQFRAAGLEDWMDQVIAEAERPAPDEGPASDDDAAAGEAPGDAGDPVPSWADDVAEDEGDGPPSDADGSADDTAEASADDPSAAGEADADEGGPDMLGGVNGIEGEKELG
jgi:hypothetical protein